MDGWLIRQMEGIKKKKGSAMTRSTSKQVWVLHNNIFFKMIQYLIYLVVNSFSFSSFQEDFFIPQRPNKTIVAESKAWGGGCNIVRLDIRDRVFISIMLRCVRPRLKTCCFLVSTNDTIYHVICIICVPHVSHSSMGVDSGSSDLRAMETASFNVGSDDGKVKKGKTWWEGGFVFWPS